MSLTHNPQKDLSLAGWLERWVSTYAPTRCKSLKSIERYRQLTNYVRQGATQELAIAAATPLAALTPIALEEAIVSLFNPRPNGRILSTQTVRHVGAILRCSLQKAWRLGILHENPMNRVDLPHTSAPAAIAFEIGEIEQLRQTCKESWTFTFVELALATGCRRGELLALEWSDVNWKARLISISKSLEQTSKGLRVKSTKSGKPRLLSLPQAAVNELLAAYQHRNDESPLIFPGKDGRHRKPDTVSQIIRNRILQARISRGSLHTLRHTHATHLLSEGVPLKVVSERLGHSDPGFTARVYAHVLAADDRRAANAWDKLISEARSIERKPPQREKSSVRDLSSTA